VYFPDMLLVSFLLYPFWATGPTFWILSRPSSHLIHHFNSWCYHYFSVTDLQSASVFVIAPQIPKSKVGTKGAGWSLNDELWQPLTVLHFTRLSSKLISVISFWSEKLLKMFVAWNSLNVPGSIVSNET